MTEAAYLEAHATGELRAAVTLLGGARNADPDFTGSLLTATTAALLLLNSDTGDVETAHRVSLISRSEGAVTAESWQALPYDQFLGLMEQVE